MSELADDEMIQAWKGILFSHARVVRGLEADLLEQHGLSLTWFDVMNRVREAPGQRLRMNELEEASLFTRSGMTRLVDRIEAAGFVRRERSVEDRRGVYVAITSAGIEKSREVWPDHIASIRQHFGRHIDPRDALALQRAGAKIQND